MKLFEKILHLLNNLLFLVHGKLYLIWILNRHLSIFHEFNILKILTKNLQMKNDLMHVVSYRCLPYQKWPITEAGDEIFDELFVVKR